MVKIIKDPDFKQNIANKVYKLNKLLGTDFKHAVQLKKAYGNADIETIITLDNVSIDNYTYTLLGIGKELSKERFYQLKAKDFEDIKTETMEVAQNYLDEDFRLNKKNFMIEALARIDAINSLRVLISVGKGFYNRDEIGMIDAQKTSVFTKVLLADGDTLPSKQNNTESQLQQSEIVNESDNSDSEEQEEEAVSENNTDDDSEASSDEEEAPKRQAPTKRSKIREVSDSEDSEASEDEGPKVNAKSGVRRAQPRQNQEDDSSSSEDSDDEDD